MIDRDERPSPRECWELEQDLAARRGRGYSNCLSGANAQRGDRVRNIFSDQVGECLGSTDSGRILVRLPAGDAPVKWERMSTELLASDK